MSNLVKEIDIESHLLDIRRIIKDLYDVGIKHYKVNRLNEYYKSLLEMYIELFNNEYNGTLFIYGKGYDILGIFIDESTDVDDEDNIIYYCDAFVRCKEINIDEPKESIISICDFLDGIDLPF